MARPHSEATADLASRRLRVDADALTGHAGSPHGKRSGGSTLALASQIRTCKRRERPVTSGVPSVSRRGQGRGFRLVVSGPGNWLIRRVGCRGQAGTLDCRGVTAGKSQFFDGEDLGQLADTNGVNGVLQKNGNTRYVMRAPQDVGVDRTTGLPTDVYTVIRKPDGSVLTMFPGTSPRS